MSENYIPKIENSDEDIRELSYKKAYEMYGENLPIIVQERLEMELTAIIENGFSSIYMLAQKIANYAKESGHLIGIGGAIGNSFVARMLGITLINPLKAHCLCQKCKHVDFTSETLKVYSNIKVLNCPICGEKLTKDGYELPFEILARVDLNEQPYIDLRVSYEFQVKVYEYISQLFGEDNVLKLFEQRKIIKYEDYCATERYFENSFERADLKTTTRKKVKSRSTYDPEGFISGADNYFYHCYGPEGIIIMPPDKNINDYSPIYNLENDNIIYFNCNKIYNRLFRQSIVTDLTISILETLENITHVDSTQIDLDDKAIIDLLTETDIMCDIGVSDHDHYICWVITEKTKPNSLNDLVKIYGLVRGDGFDGTWTDNGEKLIDSGMAKLEDLVSSKDDIMVYLINKGIDRKNAFNIMEDFSTVSGVLPKQKELLKSYGVPTWYIEYGNKLGYLPSKSHIIDYVMRMVRIGYFKVYYPEAFYQTILTMEDDWDDD